ncbi:MAG: hypothetical protein WBJ01_09460 [Tissierellaceae bacterium]
MTKSIINYINLNVNFVLLEDSVKLLLENNYFNYNIEISSFYIILNPCFLLFKPCFDLRFAIDMEPPPLWFKYLKAAVIIGTALFKGYHIGSSM